MWKSPLLLLRYETRCMECGDMSKCCCSRWLSSRLLPRARLTGGTALRVQKVAGRSLTHLATFASRSTVITADVGTSSAKFAS